MIVHSMLNARAVLCRLEYDIEVFQDGANVLERLTSAPPPDVMVLDWVMPGISGPEVCRFLRAQPDDGTPIGILLLTAHRAVEQIVEGLSAGANDYLAKPYEPEELQARVMAQVRARELLERATRAERVNHALLESAPDAMLAIDAEGRVTFANGEACGVFECNAAEFSGPSDPGLDSGMVGTRGADCRGAPAVTARRDHWCTRLFADESRDARSPRKRRPPSRCATSPRAAPPRHAGWISTLSWRTTCARPSTRSRCVPSCS